MCRQLLNFCSLYATDVKPRQASHSVSSSPLEKLRVLIPDPPIAAPTDMQTNSGSTFAKSARTALTETTHHRAEKDNEHSRRNHLPGGRGGGGYHPSQHPRLHPSHPRHPIPSIHTQSIIIFIMTCHRLTDKTAIK